MFRAAVIDDEPLIVRSITNLIEMSDEEFQVVGTANDGKTALGMIEEVKPDIIFVDISMPVMDGFQFLEEIRERGNTVPAVILSGYQEFSYARRAIRLGVLDYLVKPVNPLTMETFLSDLKKKLTKNRRERQEECLQTYLRGGSADSTDRTLFDEGSSLCLVRICYGTYIFFRNNQFLLNRPCTGKREETSICREIFGDEKFWILDGKEENESFLIIQAEKKNVFLKVRRVYEEIKKTLIPGETVTFAVPNKLISPEELCKEKVTLETLLYHKSIFGQSNYLKQEDQEKSRKLEEIEVLAFQSLAKSKKETEFLELLKRTLDKCKEELCTQGELIEILKKIMNSSCQFATEYEVYFMLNLVIGDSRNYEELYKKTSEVILEYSGIRQEREEGMDYLMIRIKEYLDDQYKNRIRIQDVADLFGLNYSYLCHMFRKSIGISPNEYLIVKRMEMAKKLLSQPGDLSIKDIAAMIGYPDQYYFSRAFKAYAGKSPSDYRREENII